MILLQSRRLGSSKYLAISGNGTLTQNRHQRKTNFCCGAKSWLTGKGEIPAIPDQIIDA
ncbi:hypothetical protein H5V43_08875 [Sphingobium fuliginis]|jgi:hypothetical protein|uniref:Uncharacterized protein n=1 Tax=Sphingobium fuliginis (strain ATCC 27551) TaxID=336203 RepID=A0A7M2GD05_SPHSA|nr:hypothetical protein [Sphingobium fuliginis]QOT70285.1 hypothetical protein H5V43_08875 [Sphingobium fuliginis]